MIPLVDISLWSIAKVFIIFANFIYIVFAFVVIRQVKMMTDTLELGYDNLVKNLSYLNLILGIVVLLYSYLTL